MNIFGALKKAWLLFNSAILGTPVGWILIGLIAVIAALAINWEDFKKNFGDTAFGSAVIQMVQGVCAWWDRLTNAFSEGSWSKIFIEIINAVTAPLRKFLELVGWALEKVGLIDKDSSFYGMTKPLDEKAFETVGKVAGGLEMQTPDYLSGMPGTYSPLPQGYTPPEKPKTTGGTHSWFRMQTPDYTMGVPSGSAALSPDRGIPQKLVPTFQGMQYGSGLTATAGVLNRQGQTPAPSPAIASLNAPRTLDVPRGGIMRSITNTTNSNTNNQNQTVNIGSQNFTIEGEIKDEKLREYIELGIM